MDPYKRFNTFEVSQKFKFRPFLFYLFLCSASALILWSMTISKSTWLRSTLTPASSFHHLSWRASSRRCSRMPSAWRWIPYSRLQKTSLSAKTSFTSSVLRTSSSSFLTRRSMEPSSTRSSVRRPMSSLRSMKKSSVMLTLMTTIRQTKPQTTEFNATDKKNWSLKASCPVWMC